MEAAQDRIAEKNQRIAELEAACGDVVRLVQNGEWWVSADGKCIKIEHPRAGELWARIRAALPLNEAAEQERDRLRVAALKAFTVVEWVVGEGRLLQPPHFDADDLLLELVALLGVETSEQARAALEQADD